MCSSGGKSPKLSQSHWSLWPQKRFTGTMLISLSSPPSRAMARVHYYFTDLEFLADSRKPTCCHEARDIGFPSLSALGLTKLSLSAPLLPLHPTGSRWPSSPDVPKSAINLTDGTVNSLVKDTASPPDLTWASEFTGFSVIHFPGNHVTGLSKTSIKTNNSNVKNCKRSSWELPDRLGPTSPLCPTYHHSAPTLMGWSSS